MIREEAIEILKDLWRTKHSMYLEADIRKALEMAIQALEQEPKYCDRNICLKNEYNGIGCDECDVTKSQEPCEDAISRQAVLDGLASIAKAKAKSDAQKSLMGRVMFFTERLPSVKPQEPKTGHWIWQAEDIYQCSECGEDIHVKEVMNKPQYAWCPMCGCPMEIER